MKNKTNSFSSFTPVKQAWSHSWKQPSFRVQFIFFLAVVIGFAFFFPYFFDYLEARDGKILNDPLLNLIPPKDISWTVFFFLYSGILIGLFCNILKPKNFLIGLEIYALVTLLRITSLSLVALNPPPGYIALKEPFVQLFTNGGRLISKDLFFSGHVSTILAFYFSVGQKQFKNILLIFSVMVGCLVLVQHVHYTIDVLVSPLATLACSLFVKKSLTKNIL
ncbi:MAG: phosphatase PAP2-related protein [Bacteroidetes bacterium]|nr:phosphatase PAP2-related protein [Bacteroidota bacterium]